MQITLSFVIILFLKKKRPLKATLIFLFFFYFIFFLEGGHFTTGSCLTNRHPTQNATNKLTLLKTVYDKIVIFVCHRFGASAVKSSVRG